MTTAAKEELKPQTFHIERATMAGYEDKAVDMKRVSEDEYAPVGRENLHAKFPPHDEFWGIHRYDPAFEWQPEEESRVVRKADFRLLTMIMLMFVGLQLDRGNVSNATTDNLLKDLKLTTNDYNNGTTIQVLAFLICEFPSQYIIMRVGFKIWLPLLMMGWGTVSAFQSFMTDRTGFYICRALIGACEGGFIPGAILYISNFYTSGELAIRLSYFWAALNVARVFSALLAAGILQMRGLVPGRSGWFWLFLLEGLFTMVVAIAAYCWLPWSPTDTKTIFWRKAWYNEREEKIAVNRILRDDPAKGLNAIKSKLTVADLKAAWADKHIWCLVFIGLIAYIPANPVQAYIGLSLKNLGFNTLDANLLTSVSAFGQIVTMLALSYSAKRFGRPLLHCFIGEFWIFPLLLAVLLLPDQRHIPWIRYALITLISSFPYFHPILSSIVSENAFDVKKRSIQLTTYNVVVQMGAVVGSQIYRADDKPFYHRGNKVLIAICALSLVTFVATWFYFGYLNNQKEKIWSQMTEQEKLEYQEDLAAREKEGNRRLDFRLTR